MLSFPFPYLFRTQYLKSYECFPVSKIGNAWGDMQLGGKIILPRSAMQSLGLKNFRSPLLFKVTNSGNNRSTHVGVLEFTAEMGTCYVPDWIYKYLDLEESSKVNIEMVALPIGTFVKFQPIGLEFLSIKNPKALLEIELHRYACLTKDDVINLHYMNHIYKLRVVETKPADAIAIIIGNLNIEFDAPEFPSSLFLASGIMLNLTSSDTRQSLNCKERKTSVNKDEQDGVFKTTRPRGIPHYSYSLGNLHINRNAMSITDQVFPVSLSQFSQSHPGEGYSIKQEEVD